MARGKQAAQGRTSAGIPLAIAMVVCASCGSATSSGPVECHADSTPSQTLPHGGDWLSSDSSVRFGVEYDGTQLVPVSVNYSLGVSISATSTNCSQGDVC